MATQTITVLKKGNYTNTITSDADFPDGVDWPAGVRSASLRVVSTSFTDPNESIYLEIEESAFDFNTNSYGPWKFMASTGIPQIGGQIGRNGQIILPALIVNLGDEELAIPRKVKGKLVIVGTINLSLVADIFS